MKERNEELRDKIAEQNVSKRIIGRPFEAGNPGGPGRPKLTKDKICLSMLFEKHGFEWADELAALLKSGKYREAKEFIPYLPYLCFQVHANPIELKPDSPETSVTNADALLAADKAERMKALDALKPAS